MLNNYSLFKKFIFLLFNFLFFLSIAKSATLHQTPIGLDTPWGMAWVDDSQLLITQKSGEIYLVDINNYSQKKN